MPCNAASTCSSANMVANQCLAFSLYLCTRLQMFIGRNLAPDPRMDVEAAKEKAGAISFPAGTKALFLGRAHYGCVATVLPPLEGEVSCCRVCPRAG